MSSPTTPATQEPETSTVVQDAASRRTRPSRPHSHTLYLNAESPIHTVRPEIKLGAVFAFVAAVALTRSGSYLAFAIDGVALLAVAMRARVPLRFIARRMLVALPFVAFAFILPFVAEGEQTRFAAFTVSLPGLHSAATILAKAGLGMGASILLAATTEVPAILRGLRRLHVPVPIVAIAGFAFRFTETIAGELARMRIAMAARGYEARWFWQARPVAVSAGATFVRSYERGERVHAAMLARGFDGTMPDLDSLLVERHSHTRPQAQLLFGLAAVAIIAALLPAGLLQR